MMLPLSNWVWTHAPFLAVAEFPWRLLGLTNLSLAFLAGAGVRLIPVRGRTAFALLAVLAVILGAAVYLYPPHPFVRYGETVADMARYELATQTIGTTTLGEYLPRWVEEVPTGSPLAEALSQGESVEKLDRATLPAGATARLLGRTAVSDSYSFDSPQPFRARFFTFYFPGWRAYLDGKPTEIAVEAGTGFITVPIPSGRHELHLQFIDTPLRAASNALTRMTLTAVILVSLWRGARRRPPSTVRRQRPASSLQPLAFSHLLFATGLIGLLLVKSLLVDPHTDWFRRQSPPDRVLGVQHPLRVDLDGRFWLLGYDLSREAVAQGGVLRVVLYWQAQQSLSTNYRSFVHLDAPTDRRTWAGSDNFHPGDATAQMDIPTSTWDRTHYVRDEHILRIPPEVPPVRFDLRAGLYDPDTGRRLPIVGEGDDTITLQSVQVVAGRGLRPADVPHPVNYRLGEHIRLLGYDWDPTGAELTLYWQSDQPLATDYVVFVHLLDAAGNRVWGADAPPLGGLYPTSAWEPGLIVADPRPLLPGDLPPGEYTLAVGMYHPDTLVRLPVTDAAADADGRPVADNVIRLTLGTEDKGRMTKDE